jgi:uncharacterized protein (TIGR02466 family)
MPIKAHFPTLVYSEPLRRSSERSSLASFNRELLKECYQFRDHDKKGRQWSKQHYPSGYTSYSSLSAAHELSSTFAALKSALDFHVKRFARQLGYDAKEHPLEITSCWINIMPAHAHHSLHLHPLSTLSGSYYVKTPSQGGDIKFEDPRLSRMMAAPPRSEPRHTSFVRYKPRAGQVILFESWLRHEVEANRGGEDRVSISFNYNWF